MKKTVTIPVIAILAMSIASLLALSIGPTATAGAVSPPSVLALPPQPNPTIVPPKQIYPTYVPPTYVSPPTVTEAPTTGGATTATSTAPTTMTTTQSSSTSTTTTSTTTTATAAPTELVLLPPVGVSKVPKGGIKTGDGSTVRGRR